MAYNPKQVYTFIDENGNRVYSNGDNGYIWDAYENGLGISMDDNGNWFTRPYIESSGNGSITAVMPEWFKHTNEYEEWTKTYVPQIKNRSLTEENISSIQRTLSSLSDLGALRQSLRSEAAGYGIKSLADQDKYVNNVTAVAYEGNGAGKANLNFSALATAKDSSAADIARMYKGLSKEELSSQMSRIYDILQQSSDGKFKGSQQEVLEAATLARLLNYVDENHSQYGKDDEFKGLLEPSQWQRFQAGIAANMANLTYNSVFGLPTRVIDKIAEANGGNLMPNTYEAYVSELVSRPIAGGSLGNVNQQGGGSKNTEGDIQWGNFIGSLEIIGATVARTMAGQTYVQGKLAAAPVGTKAFALSQLIDSGGFIVNTLVTDFVMNDLPMDVFLLISDADQYGWERAFYDPENPQNLWGVPFIHMRNGSLVNEYGVPNLGGFGPEVPGGFAFNVLGDLTLDFAPKIISTTLGQVDNLTGGYLARAKQKIKDSASLATMKAIEGVQKVPVVGDAIKKTVNFFAGSSDANMVRTAKKTAVATNDVDWYVNAQKILTQQNHGGYEAVGPRFRKILNDTGVTKWTEYFTKNKNDYGGIHDRTASIKDIEGGETKTRTRGMRSVLPEDVINGLLDIQRLAELKGEAFGEAGLIPNPSRTEEIAALEERVNNLPQQIKDFATAFHEANIQVNKLIEDLGLRPEGVTEKWMEDPRFEYYMVRQTLMPETFRRTGAPDNPSILSKKRTGSYNRDTQIDPTIALAMKVEAIGKAWAYNERKKFVAAMAEASNHVTAGVQGMQAATKLSEVKTQIQDAQVMRDTLGYDAVLSKFNSNVDTVNNAFQHINELLNLPNSINAKSVFTASMDPDVKNFKADFTAGKVKYADGLDTAGLNDAALSDVMNNTYRYDNGAGAGVTNDGVPYFFEVKKGEVTSIRKAETAKELADSVTGLSGSYGITEETVKTMGETNVHAINRTLLFYRENLPEIAEKTIFKIEHDDPRVYGWCKVVPDGITVKDGKVSVEEWEVFVNHSFYDKGHEARTLQDIKGDVQSGFHPKNSADLSNVFIHENGHSMMGRLALLELNQKIQEGKIGADKVTIAYEFRKYRDAMQEEILYNAMKRMGIDGPDGNHQKLMDQRRTVSRYAWDPESYTAKNSETIAESMVDYAFNGQNASPLAQAVVAEIQERLGKFSTVASPKETLTGNGLSAPKGLLKGEGYNFPAGVKTKAQEAKWLNDWRQKNPYLKGAYTEEKYKLANTWDSFFQKEINSRNPKQKTEAPDLLVKKNADFLDNLNKNAAKHVVEEIQKASINGINEDLAMLVLSRNYTDSAEALNRFIIGQVDDAARSVAEKMPGGVTEENLETARITLWSDENIKTYTTNLVSNLVPGTKLSDIQRNVDVLFKTQAEGLAAASTLPIDVKDLVAQKKRLQGQLAWSNRHAQEEGVKADNRNKGQYVGNPSQVIHYMDGGEDVYVVVDDPVIASVIERPMEYKEHGQVGELWNATAKFVAQTYRLGTTGANLPSLIRNFLRDPFQATMSTEFNPLNIQLDPRYFYRTLRGFGLSDSTIDTVLNQINTRATSSTLTAEIRGLGLSVPGSAAYNTKIQKASRALERSLDIKLIKKGQMPLEAWEGFMRNQVGQQAFIRHYKRTGDVNKSLGRALLETSNATTDFSHAVAGLRNVTSTIPYLSSAINGARSFGVLFTIDPVGMIGRISAGFMMPVMAITAWNLSSEERRKAYMQLPEWYKSTHIVLISPDGKTKFALPIPEEISNYSTLTRNLIEYTNDVSPYTINMILARGVFGMLPTDIDGFFADDGSINWEHGFQQMISGLTPQLVTAIWEQVSKRDTYTGQSYENLDALNQAILFGSNIFGTGFRQVANDIGMMVGQPDKIKIGLSTAETLSRDLFGMGFHESTNQFMSMIGSPKKPEEFDEQGNKIKDSIPATGLFKENEELKAWVDKKNTERAVAKDNEEIAKIDKEIEDRVNAFAEKVGNLTNRYMQLYSITGGLEDWQKDKIIQLLTLGDAWSSSSSTSYENEDAQTAFLNERGLAAQRYVQAGLPTDVSLSDLASGSSIGLQAALNSFYGAPRQAATDFRNAVESAGIKDIRDEFYAVIDQIYDSAEEQGLKPDYDLIEKIQARYLQAVDAAIIPVLNQYGIGVLNNADFIDAVRKQVNGMIPSDDWKQSTKNAKKFLSSKEFPTATVDVKKWLMQRYAGSMRDRNLGSDQEVVDRLEEIRVDIDAGRRGTAKGKIKSLMDGVNKANYYISGKDLQTLSEYNNMLK